MAAEKKDIHGQSWEPERYRRNAAFVARLGKPVVELLDPQPGERILDVGCGDGALTKALAEVGAQVTGVDASAEQIDAARKLGLDAHVMRAEDIDFPPQFDAVFSNAAMHWVGDPGAAVRGIHGALKPGGRFVGEMGGAGNIAGYVAAIESALCRRGVDPGPLNPWYFPDEDEFSRLLTQAGFHVTGVERFPRKTVLETDPAGWIETFGEVYLMALPEQGRADFQAEVTDLLRPDFQEADGRWWSDYVRLRWRAEKPAD